MKHVKVENGESGDDDIKAAADKQRSFFWFHEPNLVISLLQWMQFGYASSLSIVIMFWDDLGHEIPPTYFLAATLGCYSVFLYVLAKVLPQYTLCTSLGNLVKKKALQETVALHRLQEAQRRQKRKLIQLTFENNSSTDSIVCMDEVFFRQQLQDQEGNNDSNEGSNSHSASQLVVPGSGALLQHQSSSNVAGSRHGDKDSSHNSDSKRIEHKDSSTLLAELVKMDTAALRQQLPEQSQHRLLDREQRMKERRMNRKKAVSDGVQAMRGMAGAPGSFFTGGKAEPGIGAASASTGLAHINSFDNLNYDRATRMANRRARREKAASASGVIQEWQNSTQKEAKKGPLFNVASKSKDDSYIDAMTNMKKSPPPSPRLSGLKSGKAFHNNNIAPNSTATSTAMASMDEAAKLHRQLRSERVAARKANRKKAVSASAVIQSWRDYSVADVPSTKDLEDPPAHELFHEDQHWSNSGLRGMALPDVSEEIHPHGSAMDSERSSFFKPSVTAPASTAAKSNETPAAIGVVIEDGKETHELSPPIIVPETAIILDNLDEVQKPKRVGFSSEEGDNDSLIQFGNDGDDTTVDTGKSVGELSDVAAVKTQEFATLRSNYQWEEQWHEKLRRNLSPSHLKLLGRAYFLGDRYPVVSHVFGTIAVFFLIGMRVEAMNAVTGIYDASDNTWELPLNYSFWTEFTWYLFFIIMGIFLVWSVPTAESTTEQERIITISGAMDLLLTVVCLILLIMSEVERCCDSDGDSEDYHDLNATDDHRSFLMRFLAEESTSSTNTYDDDIWTQCCPPWGFRTHGGLGSIEPFTALIGLRILRFSAARYIVRTCWFNNLDSHSFVGTEQENGTEEHGHHGHGHGHGGATGQKGTALELWESAISKYPHIVERYGQFSSELFQAMLGLDVIDYGPSVPKAVAPMTEGQGTVTAESNDAPNNGKEEEDAIQPKSTPVGQPLYKLNGEQYACLSAKCQGIILAGKLGKPVKLKCNPAEGAHLGQDLPTLQEHSGSEVKHNFEFEVDDERVNLEESADSSFIAPNARLIRSMRRCDRRLYPLLQEWLAVDVVMTEYEIVYFEAKDEDLSDLPPEDKAAKAAMLLAIQKTKGGKGLRLVDVAIGRKVVGHLNMSDITELHVVRDMPLMDVSHLIEAEPAFNHENDEYASEYWYKHTHIETPKHSRNVRWAKVKEDRLKLYSVHGTLVLRFFSDLNDVEARLEASNNEDELNGDLKKNVAFQWAQTVAHICGKDQLKQVLPHFGTDDSEELRDYLEVVHHHNKTEEPRSHRRGRSSVQGIAFQVERGLSERHRSPLRGVNEPLPSNLSKPKLLHSRSMGETSTTASSRNKPPRVTRGTSTSVANGTSTDEHMTRVSSMVELRGNGHGGYESSLKEAATSSNNGHEPVGNGASIDNDNAAGSNGISSMNGDGTKEATMHSMV